jgi:hypothetical protein
MIGPREDDQQHLVIHWDAGLDESVPEPPNEPSYDQLSLLQRYRYWLITLVVLAGLGAIVYFAGEATYNPPSRLPALNFSTDAALYGTNAAVASEIELLRRTFADPESVQLEPTGRVFRVPLPRTLGDRLFGERDEVATIFAAGSPAGEHRFLLLTGDDGRRIYAIEAPLSLSPFDQPAGVFLALDTADATFEPLIEALESLLPRLEEQETLELSPERVYVFGPYEGGDAERLSARVVTNTVMRHLSSAIEEADGSVSLAAPVFLVAGGPARGTINALYHPPRRTVMEPLWGESSTGSLAHELVHAYLDTVVEDKSALLATVIPYLENAHPVLHGQVVDDLYRRLGPEGRAEETLAFIAGAIAARQTKTVATQRLLDNPGNFAISEAILYSDAGLLVQIGLLPSCMLPNEGATGEITQRYYEMVDGECE